MRCNTRMCQSYQLHLWRAALYVVQVALREMQQRSGGITEFVPLPFVHMEAPIYIKAS